MGVAALVMLFFGNFEDIGCEICRKSVVTGSSLVTRWITEYCVRKKERECEDKGELVVVIVCFPSWKLAFVCASRESW